jgi:hypothetical protein
LPKGGIARNGEVKGLKLSDVVQIILGLLFLVLVYLLTRYGMYLRVKHACGRTIKDLERQQAFDEKSAVELPYAKSQFLRIGLRDFRPKAVESLIQGGIVGVTEEGKYFLKKRSYEMSL